MIDDEFERSNDLWIEAIALGSGLSRLEDELGLLETLSRADKWQEYRRWLMRLVREARRTNLGFETARRMARPGRVWLARGFPMRAAGTFAWAILIGAEEWSNRRQEEVATTQTEAGVDDRKTVAEQLGEDLIGTNLSVAEALTAPEIDSRDRATCKAAIMRQVRRNAPDAADAVIELLLFAESSILETRASAGPEVKMDAASD